MKQSELFTQWRAIPNFNATFPSLADCVALCAEEFHNRPRQVFLIVYSPRYAQYYVVPWEQWRHLPPNHEAMSGVVVFRGTIPDMRCIAFHFPPDLFQTPTPEPSAQSSDDSTPDSDDSTDPVDEPPITDPGTSNTSPGTSPPEPS